MSNAIENIMQATIKPTTLELVSDKSHSSAPKFREEAYGAFHVCKDGTAIPDVGQSRRAACGDGNFVEFPPIKT